MPSLANEGKGRHFDLPGDTVKSPDPHGPMGSVLLP
jgi:hypothetical protein